ncbi:hypothetical protein BJ165DRAFT_1608055 [Panaeolus papilionaceus]|nr:hypothetical protein BJ165DRAFT_1608055 [Panaeolus papilionaceus]
MSTCANLLNLSWPSEHKQWSRSPNRWFPGCIPSHIVSKVEILGAFDFNEDLWRSYPSVISRHLASVAPASTARDTVSTAEVAREATSDDDTVGDVEAETTAGTNNTTDAVTSTELADVPIPQAAAGPEAGNALAERPREDVAAAADGEPEAEAGPLGVDVFLFEDLEGDFDGLGTDEGFELLHFFIGGVVHVDVCDVGIGGEWGDLVVLLLL